jgi:hypothetical protein
MTHKTQHENKQIRTQKTKKDEQYGPHKNWKTQHENKQIRTQKTKKDEQYGPHKNWK